MVRRWTEIGDLFRRDPEAAKRVLVETLEEVGGNYRRAAWLLGITKPWLCRLLRRHGLSSVPREARARATRPTWLTSARRRLAMDEQLNQIVAACQGKSEDEILELIQSSAIASELEDPGLVAAYVAHLAGAA